MTYLMQQHTKYSHQVQKDMYKFFLFGNLNSFETIKKANYNCFTIMEIK